MSMAMCSFLLDFISVYGTSILYALHMCNWLVLLFWFFHHTFAKHLKSLADKHFEGSLISKGILPLLASLASSESQ